MPRKYNIYYNKENVCDAIKKEIGAENDFVKNVIIKIIKKIFQIAEII